MKNVGNQKEVAKYGEADEELIKSMEKHAGGGSFKQWKKKVTTTKKFNYSELHVFLNA